MPHDRIFLPLDNVAEVDVSELGEHTTFCNYKGVEESGIAEAEIQTYLDKQYLRAFGSEAELTSYLGATPIYNNVGVVTKERNGIVKHRMILNTCQSRVKDASAKNQMVILPRISGAVWRILERVSKASRGV